MPPPSRPRPVEGPVKHWGRHRLLLHGCWPQRGPQDLFRALLSAWGPAAGGHPRWTGPSRALPERPPGGVAAQPVGAPPARPPPHTLSRRSVRLSTRLLIGLRGARSARPAPAAAGAGLRRGEASAVGGGRGADPGRPRPTPEQSPSPAEPRRGRPQPQPDRSRHRRSRIGGPRAPAGEGLPGALVEFR
ncbi:Triple Functional Domain Protein [Manis pentadactyla]|nr:Triple Functional Domain Protein [Manis pentadactyla]